MAYEIPFTDETNKGTITVEDNVINQETSLEFVGRNRQDYGVFINGNFLKLLENFANVNPPRNPVEGQLWYDNTGGTDQLKIYDGTNWVAAGGLKKSISQPDQAVVGDLWVDTTNNQLYLYSGSGWVLVGPQYSEGIKNGAIPETITDTGNVVRNVVVNYINDVPVSIIANATFDPKQDIAGFTIRNPDTQTKINPGVNVSSVIGSYSPKFYGTTTQAEKLLVNGAAVAGDQFLQKNETNILFQSLIIRNNNGLDIGDVSTLGLKVEGTTGILNHALAGSSLDMRVNNDGVPSVAIRIKSNTNVGINNLNPDEALDVTGNIKASGTLQVNSTADSLGPDDGSAVFAGGIGVAKKLWVGDDTNILGTMVAQDLLPDVNNARNIGSASKSYDNLYANRITGNLTGNVTGNVTGTAGSTSKLNSTTNFGMSGDVTSSGFVFDGQTGGLTKTFVTTIDPQFVDNKTDIGTVQTTDEILISRPGDALYKTTQASFIGSIPVNPIGTIIMYAGLTAPAGWAFCNGDEVLLTTYSDLATALGYDPADATTWYWGTSSSPTTVMKLPDFRGRVPVGLGLPGGANRITNTALSTMGGLGGSDAATLTADNLPEHEHDFRSSDNDQFYTTTSDATASGGGVTNSSGDTAGTGSRMSQSGGILNGTNNDPIDITPPFAGVNYIIYHGVV